MGWLAEAGGERVKAGWEGQGWVWGKTAIKLFAEKLTFAKKLLLVGAEGGGRA